MFDALGERLSTTFDKLTRRGALSEGDVQAAMREVRVALLEADVALPVVKDFIAGVKKEAVGAKVLKSVTPGQQVIKIVHDALVDMLGGDAAEDEAALNLAAVPPVAVLMVGLQGSGKTTTTAKLAKRLSEKDGKKVMMASLDTRRPAAMEQLATLGEQIGVATLPIVPGQGPKDIAKRALKAAKLQGMDVLLLDTAGRMAIDQALMAEVKTIRDVAKPAETLLVADSLTGQDAVNTAKAFDEEIGISGVVLTRMDGDGRGGAALSMRAVTGKPIKYAGVGEKADAIEVFHARRVAGRILGQGDIVSLVEKAAETVERDEAERIAKKMAKGKFDLEDLHSQLAQMQKMGGVGTLMGMMPGMGGNKAAKQLAAAGLDEKTFKHQDAIINSMTPKERRNPALLNASRKRRIAAGSGTSPQEINRLLKMHKQMAGMMKKMGKMGMLKGMLGGGMPDPAMLEAADADQAPDLSKLPAMPGIGPGGLPGGLPGLGGGPGPKGAVPPDLARLIRKK